MMKLYYNRKLKKSGVCHYMFNIFSGNFKECSKSICDYLKFSKLQKKKVYTHLYRIFLSCSLGTREQN